MKHRATHADFGRSITLRAGDELEVELVENATTGFFWHVETDAPSVVVPGDSEYALPADRNAAGAAGTHRFTFLARTEGVARLEFRLVCSWLPDERPDRGAIEIHVRP